MYNIFIILILIYILRIAENEKIPVWLLVRTLSTSISGKYAPSNAELKVLRGKIRRIEKDTGDGRNAMLHYIVCLLRIHLLRSSLIRKRNFSLARPTFRRDNEALKMAEFTGN